MALVLADRVRETTTTTGTGTVSLAGPVAGFEGFSTAIGNANTTYYTIVDAATGAWEVGLGTYTSSGSTLARTTILSSSNAGAAVNFAAGTKDVFVTQPAERAVYVLGAGTGLAAGAAAFTANGVPYANSTSTLATSTNLTFDGTTLTANALTVSNATTLSAGTANGVTYLNASKVLTTGSALTFDGTNFGVGTSSPIYDLQVGSYGVDADSTLALASTTTGTGTIRFGDGTSGVDANAGQIQYVHTNNAMTFSTVASEQMRLTSTGLGIGTSSPDAPLTLNGSASSRINMRAGNTRYGTLFADAGVFAISSITSIPVVFGINDIEQMRLTSTGLGIGTSSPSAKLDIAGNTNGSLFNVRQTSAAGSVVYLQPYNAANGGIIYSNWTTGNGTLGFAAGTSTAQMVLTNSGNLGIGTSSPGERLNVLGGGATSSTVNFTGGATGDDNATIASDFSLIFQIDANNNIGSREFNWRVGGKGYSDGTSLMALNSSGNLGLGVTPSAWGSGWKALQVAPLGGTSLWSDGGIRSFLSTNVYFDGSNRRYAANGAAFEYGQTVAGHTWNITPSGTAGDVLSFSQAMTLDASGNLLVNRTSVLLNSKVSVDGSLGLNGASGDGVLRLYTADTQYGGIASAAWAFGGGASTTDLALLASNNLIFGANGAERARITSGGDFLIGTTDATQTAGPGVKIKTMASPNDGVVSCVGASSTDANETFHVFSTGASAYRFYVNYAGTVFATSTTISAISDRRLKENIRDLDDGLDVVMALKPRKFDWKEGKGENIKNARGFIAQEFETVLPDMIKTWKDPAPEGEEPYKAVNANLIPTLVKAIQEQQTLITALTARITALESSTLQ
jgi:hypothetical protein